MYHELHRLWKDLLNSGLKDDGWPWDWTSLGISHSGQQSKVIKAKVMAKSEGVWAAESLVSALCAFVGGAREASGIIQAESKISDGVKFHPGDCVVEMSGASRELLALERPFLNLATYVSGIATQTASVVEKVKQACPKNTPRVTLTRKTLPGYRDVSIQGVRAGGGFPHRVSLSGGVLIKENHIAAAGGILKAVEAVKTVAPHGLKIEVEVRSEKELHEALKSGAEGLLLDNFSPEEVKSALQILKKLPLSPFVEVSGGLSESNIASYSLEGVHILSLGSLTHSVQGVDLSLLVD